MWLAGIIVGFILGGTVGVYIQNIKLKKAKQDAKKILEEAKAEVSEYI